MTFMTFPVTNSSYKFLILQFRISNFHLTTSKNNLKAGAQVKYLSYENPLYAKEPDPFQIAPKSEIKPKMNPYEKKNKHARLISTNTLYKHDCIP